MAYGEYTDAQKNQILKDTQQSYYNNWAKELNSYYQWGDSKASGLSQYGNNLFGNLSGGGYTDFLNWTQKPQENYQQSNLSTAPYARFYNDGAQYLLSRDSPAKPGILGWTAYVDALIKPKVGTDAKDWIGAHAANTEVDTWLEANSPKYVFGSTGMFNSDYQGYRDIRDFFGSDADLDRSDLTNAFNWLGTQYDKLGNAMDTNPDIPLFSTNISGFGGDTLALSIPNIREYTGDQYRQAMSDPYAAALQWYDNYAAQMAKDQSGLQSRYDTLNANYSGFDNALRSIDVNNIDGYGDSLRQQILNAQQGIGNYTNEYYDWLRSNNQTYSLSDGRTFSEARDALKGQYGDLLSQLDEISAEREAQLAAYNAFRNSMRGNLRDLEDQVSGYDLMGWYNNSDAVTGQLRDYRSQIEGYESDLNDLDFSTSLGLLRDITSDTNALQLGFDNEWNRYEASRNDWRNSLSDLQTGMGQTDWFNKTLLDQYNNQTQSIENRINNYDSEISELFDFTRSRELINAIESMYGDKLGQYNAEEQRVDEFRTGMRDELGGLLDLIGQVNGEDFVNAQNTLEGYDDRLTQIQRQLRDFESELKPNFSVSNNLVSDAQSDLSRALMEALSAQNQFDSRITGSGYNVSDLERLWARLQSGDDNLNYLSRDNLDAYSGLIDEFGTDRTVMSSELERLLADAQGLGYSPESLAALQDRFGAMGDLTEFQGALGEAMTQRTTELDELFSQLAGYQSELSGLSETDEQSRLDLINALNELMSDATRFSGGRADDLTASTSDLFGNIEDGLDSIYDSRYDLEQEAKDLLAQMNDRQYYNTGIIDSDRTLLDDLLGRIDEYGAEQARDEYRAMDSRLLGELQRIERDREQALAAQEAERQRLASGSFGMSNDELAYLANWLRNRTSTDDYNYADSAFARAFGLEG